MSARIGIETESQIRGRTPPHDSQVSVLVYSETNTSGRVTNGEPVPLSKLRGGDRAIVCETRLDCDDCELLQAMGLIDQALVRVCQPGPPCIIQVNSTRLGLSATVADKIFVHPDPALG